jgi:hypothetical protein
VNSSAATNANQTPGDVLEGLEDFYEVEVSAAEEVPGNSKGTAQTAQDLTGTAHWLTVEEAARRLEISPNAVIKRLGKGKLAGRKVPGQFGDKWMVDPSGLPQEVHVHLTEEQPSPAQEGPGNSRGTAREERAQPSPNDQLAQKSFDVLAEVIRQQTEQIRLQNDMIKHLSTQVQEKDGQIKLLTDTHQQSTSWWAKFSAWFLGAK